MTNFRIKTFIHIIIVAIFCWIQGNSTYGQPYFQKTYGGNSTDEGRSVWITSDGGFIIGGSTASFGSGSDDVYLVKLDVSGDTMWTKASGTPGSEKGHSIQQTADNGYIVGGTNGSMYLNKFDVNGNSIWAKSYGGTSIDEGHSVQEISGNGYILAGFTASNGAGGNDVYLVRTNSNGDIIWANTYGGTGDDKGYSVDQTSDGGYIVCGQTNSFGAGSNDVFLLKVNSAGTLQWAKTYGDTANDEGRSIVQTADGGYILTGNTESFGSGLKEIYTIKTDSLGVVQWSKTYGEFDGDDLSNYILETSGGNYIITGSTNSFGSSSIVTYLLKIDVSGNPFWPFPEMRMFGGIGGTDIGYSIRETPDGGYAFVSSSQSYGAGGSDVYLVRTNAMGDSSSTCGTGAVSPQVSSPNTIEAVAATFSSSGGIATSVSAISTSIPTETTKLPLGVLITTTGVSCFGDSDGQAIATVNAGSPPYSYIWSIGSSTTSINTGLSPGTYALSVLDAFGCQQIDSFTIDEPNELLISFTVDTIAGCGGGSNGVITGNITGGTGPFSYNWSNGANLSNTIALSHTINGLSPGSYILTVSDANGCIAVDTIKSGMTFTSGSTDANCSTANGSAWVSVTGGDTPYSFLWNDPGVQTTDSAIGLTPGVYTVFVTDSNGCTDSTSINVNSLNGGPIVTIDSIIDINCFGINNGGIYITITDGVFGLPPYSILWSNGAITEDITGLNGGIYTVMVTETSTGCVTSAIATVSAPTTALAVTFTDSSDITCNGVSDGSATISASGGTSPFTYVWSPSGGNGTVANNLSANSYTATIIDANGCTASNNVSISEPAPISIATDTIGETCAGGDGKAWVVAAGGISPYTFLWSDGNAQVTDTAFNLISGVYFITVTDNNGCSNIATATITQNGNPPIITLDSLVNISCNNGNDGGIYVTINGGLGPYTYSWLPGSQITEDITGLSAGTYTLTVADNNGCVASGNFSITEPSVLSLTLNSTNITCSGYSDGTASASGNNGTSPYTYNWSTGSTSSSISGLTAGSYSVTVFDNCNDSVSNPLILNDPTGVIISNENSVNVICFGNTDGSISITANGGTAPLSYSINGGISFPNTTGNFTGLGAGTYDIAVQDSNGCTVSGSTLIISEPTDLSIDSEIPTDVVGCAGMNSGIISISASGGTAPISYSIDGGSTYSTSGIFNTLIAGTYNIMIKDSNNCTLSGSTLVINEPAAITISNESFSNITCGGANDGTINISASGGTGGLVFSIDGGLTFSNSSGIFISLGTGTYDVIVQDSLGCETTGSTFIIFDPPGISIDIETSTNITCSGNADGTISIAASGGTAPLNYSIDGGTTFSNSSGNFTGLGAGTYNIAVLDSNGCTVTGSVLTISEPTSALTILSDSSSDVSGCADDKNGNISIIANGGTNPLLYSIDGGSTFTNTSGIFTGLSGGAYNIAVQDSNGCLAIGSSIFISSPPPITVQTQFSDPTKGNCDGSASVMPSGGTGTYTFLWSDPLSQTLSTAIDLCGGLYNVTITDANGCDTVLSIELIAPSNDIFIPTAFSPDSDGNNDKFYVRGDYASINLVIYNRWGEKVFETTNKTDRWDGTLNGSLLPSDSYGYYIELNLPDGKTQIFKGDIILVR